MEGQFGVLWMSADPGCGKSVLTSFLIDELRGETTPPREVCYFFFSDNDEERNNSTSMIRSILHQLFTAQPHLFKYAVREKCTKGDRILDQFNTLWNIFLSSVADPACANIFFVIDGMDECDQSSRDQFISALHKASSDTTALASSSAALKVFVTSRPLESLKSRPFSPPTISWQAEEEMELINNDIALVVRARVGTLAARRQLSQDFQDRLVERLIGNADHTFLWVTLVLEMLERSTNASESTFNIIIDTLPSDLDGIYNRLLTQSSDTQMAQKVLHIVVAAFRPLTLREINIALAIQPDQETMEKVKRSLDPSIDYALREICGPFIRVNNSKVNLVHQTAKAFLVREPSHPSAQTDLWRHSLRPIDSHMILAEVCTMYLVLEDFGRDNILDHLRLSGSDESGSDESDSDSRPDSDMFWYVGDRTKARDERIMNKYIRRYDFLDYSARYWPAHYRQSGRPKSLRDRVYRLYNQFGNGCLFYNWFYVYSTFSSTWNYEHPELSSLMVASYFGFEELARELLEMDPTWIDMQDDKGWTALMYAALSGHEGIVTMLLEAGAGVDASGDSYTSLLRDHTALIGASAEGHSRVVQILIDHGAKIWTNTELALSTAVTMGNVDVIRVLLRNGCDIEEHDLEGQTPLHHACLNARLEAFQFLVQEGASIFAKDRRGRCALDMAAEAGAEEIVRLLLNKGMDVNSADYYGTTALDLAEEFGKYQVLHILLEHKAENFYYGYVPEPDPSEEKRHSGPSYTQRLQELRIYKDGFDVVRYLPWVLKNAVRRQLRDSPREEFILLPSDEFSTDLKGKIKEIEDVLEMERNCWHIKNNSYKTS
jgi:ankyrin repeat protein